MSEITTYGSRRNLIRTPFQLTYLNNLDRLTAFHLNMFCQIAQQNQLLP